MQVAGVRKPAGDSKVQEREIEQAYNRAWIK